MSTSWWSSLLQQSTPWCPSADSVMDNADDVNIVVHSDKQEEDEELIGFWKQRSTAPSPRSRPVSPLEAMIMILSRTMGEKMDDVARSRRADPWISEQASMKRCFLRSRDPHQTPARREGGVMCVPEWKTLNWIIDAVGVSSSFAEIMQRNHSCAIHARTTNWIFSNTLTFQEGSQTYIFLRNIIIFMLWL